MIQQKWFRVGIDQKGDISSDSQEVESKGRNGIVYRYYQAVSLADACSQAKAYWRRCLDQAAAYRKRYSDKHVSNGLCSGCGKNPLATNQYCRACADRKNARSAARRKGAPLLVEKLSAERGIEKRRAARDKFHRENPWKVAKVTYIRALEQLDALGHVAFRAWLVSKIAAKQQTQGEWHPPMAEAAE
jgi:hypothetical protein